MNPAIQLSQQEWEKIFYDEPQWGVYPEDPREQRIFDQNKSDWKVEFQRLLAEVLAAR